MRFGVIKGVGLSIKCAKCGEKLGQPGALLFSPPNKHDQVTKYHICAKCYPRVMLEALGLSLHSPPPNYPSPLKGLTKGKPKIRISKKARAKAERDLARRVKPYVDGQRAWRRGKV